MNNLEDCLELVAGLKNWDSCDLSFDVKKEDLHILNSIARQVFKGVAFTDRQKMLVQDKLSEHKKTFDIIGIDFDNVKNNLRLPLREIDRSKWIKILDYKQHNHIAVRFTFNKKLLQYIEPVKRSIYSEYDRVKKIHYFPYNAKNVYLIVESFKDADFEIEQKLLDIYNQCCNIEKNKCHFVPGIYEYTIKNMHSNTVSYIENHIGKPNQNNLYRFYDRRNLYGIEYIDQSDLKDSYRVANELTQKIIFRKKSNVIVNSTQWSLESLVRTLNELDRYPLLVVLPEQQSLDYLEKIHSVLSPFFKKEDQAVLFRHDNNTQGQPFNDFVKTHCLNNKVDINTKIVYINNNKLPKPLIKMDFRPLAMVLYPSSRLNIKLQQYSESVDLVIHYDKDATSFVRDLDKI